MTEKPVQPTEFERDSESPESGERPFGKPRRQFDVTKKVKSDTGGKPFWLPVGKITIFRNEDGTDSGYLRLNIFGDQDFHVFPTKPRS